MTVEFTPFPKISRLSRDVVVSEKLDGTNAAVVVAEDLSILAQSRTRFITPGNDNYGFAAWVHTHADELRELGPGVHFGEWWGQGIQRKYGLSEKRFSLFNVHRWGDERPECCHVVPTLYVGPFCTEAIEGVIDNLRKEGSRAVPGFMNPEGIVIFHTASSTLFKKTLDKDESPKGNVGNEHRNRSTGGAHDCNSGSKPFSR